MAKNHSSSGDKKCVIEKEKVQDRVIEAGDAGDCRCKEVAGKTPREMLDVMLNDLAFWRERRSKAPQGKK